MTRLRTLLLVILGIAVPAALVAGVYLASAGPLADVPQVVAVPANKVAAPIPPASDTTTTTDDRGGKDDRPGKCDEEEHELDPECDPRGTSGSGSRATGSGSSDDNGGSGSGSDDSGHGSGSDDSSGHGSHDDSSSGHGSGGDD